MVDFIFKPSFGNKPSVLIGRDDVLRKIREGLKVPQGTRERSSLIIGQRGMGKTVMLLEAYEMAGDLGFVATSPISATDGLLQKIVEQINDICKEKVGGFSFNITGFNAGAFGFEIGVQFSKDETVGKSFSYVMKRMCKALTDNNIGTLFVIDEVQSNHRELKNFITTFQEMHGMGLNVAVLFAGLPSTISTTLNDDVLTFLNRSRKIYLQPIDKYEIYKYYMTVFKHVGVFVPLPCLEEMASATKGSPYMMQLIGHHLLNIAEENVTVGARNVKNAIARANHDYEEDVCGAIIKNVSPEDLEFLIAMSADEDDSNFSDIINRLNCNQVLYQIYKRRLLDSGIVNQPSSDTVGFAIPQMREYIREKYM